MAKSIISEGKTTSEAIEKGLKILGLPKELVEIKVLEENKRSFFDILAPKVVKVELKEKENKREIKTIEDIETTEEELEEGKKRIEEFLNKIINNLPEGTTFEVNIKDKCVNVSIEGNNVGNLIGYRGETLYAFENILKSIASKNLENRVIVRLDIAKYKEKRVKTLQELAKNKAKIVEKTKKSITLEPMQAYERKIIHSALQEYKNIETVSIGQEPHRRIVISLK